VTAGSPLRVLLLAPMRSELRPIVKKLSLKASRVPDDTVYEGRAGTVGVVAAAVGVGPVVAARTTERLLGSGSFDHVVVSGIAGAIGRDLSIGDLVVPEVVIDARTRIEYRPTPMAGVELKGTVLTTAELITDESEVEALRRSGVGAVEMEGSGVGEVCTRLGIPWTVFRSISDRADEGVVDDSVLSLLNEDGSTNVGAALRLMLTRPGRLPGLMGLARDSAKAAGAAATAAVAATARIAGG
jgi:adenosylhomocysteine nucleosidase